ncbi:MAG: DUF4214 domain-containing protein [Roseibium sp.]|nr:DUF4214 domain-containing protein [Roseibium sp.]
MSLLNDIVNDEGITTLGAEDIASIEGLYTAILFRSASNAEAAHWAQLVNDGWQLGQIRDAILASPEAGMIVGPAVRVIQAITGETPAGHDVDAAVASIRGGDSLADLASSLLVSTPHAALDLTTGTTSEIVERLYQELLGRPADAAGRDAWVASGKSVAEILVGFTEGQEYRDRTNPIVDTYLLDRAEFALNTQASGVNQWISADTDETVSIPDALASLSDNGTGQPALALENSWFETSVAGEDRARNGGTSETGGVLVDSVVVLGVNGTDADVF